MNSPVSSPTHAHNALRTDGGPKVVRTDQVDTLAHIPVVIVGGGGTGLCAALAARDAGVDVLVVERDSQPMGTTAMSTGLIPASGSKPQRAQGIEDSPELFAKDIETKAKGEVDQGLVRQLTEQSAATVDWLIDKHGVDLSLVEGFTYPGHSALRMHGMPSRSGGELMGALANACQEAGADILTDSLVETLYVDRDDRILAIAATRPDGAVDVIGCDALILACCGFAGNQALVSELIPELSHATFHGHPGNRGHAIAWGQEMGAAIADLTAYQGHAGLAAGHAIPILWPLIAQGGVQVNRDGRRFANEASGYSEQAVEVLRQDGHVAWSIYDETRHQLMLQFDDYQQAIRAGCLIEADTLDDLAQRLGVNSNGLILSVAETWDLIESGQTDGFGRTFAGLQPLAPPFYGVRVTGALFHTQGGLEVDGCARALRDDRSPFPNLFAGGGAARGVSGSGASGYLAGNGLLTATTLGRLAGESAAELVKEPTK